MADFNDVLIEGRIVKDCLQETMQNGVSVVRFYIACNEDQKTDTGWLKRAQYVEIYIYGGYGVSLQHSLVRSAKVIVRGKIEQQKWESKGGEFHDRLVVVANKVRVLSDGRSDG